MSTMPRSAVMGAGGGFLLKKGQEEKRTLAKKMIALTKSP